MASPNVAVKQKVRALEAVGKCVTSVKFFADGSFEVLTGREPEAERSSPSGSWGDDAGEENLSRA